MKSYEKTSAHNLCETYKTTFINYKKYGNVVLDVDLKDEPEIREIILKSESLGEYEKNIKEFWVQNHQIFISKCSDIEKAYDSGIYDNIFVGTDFPKSDLWSYNAVISVDFFDHLKECKVFDNTDNTFIVYVETDKFIYRIILEMVAEKFIKIDKKRISKDSIVTD